MNDFPLAPFLIALESDGFRFTLCDYRRISMALGASGGWTTDRLRSVLLSLLVKERERQNLFLKRFDEFFDLPQEEEARFGEIDMEEAVADLRQLAGEDFPAREATPFVRRIPRLLPPPEQKKQPGKKKWRLAILLIELFFVLTLFFLNMHWIQGPPEVDIPRPGPSVSPPSPKPEPAEKDTRQRIYKNLPSVKEIKPAPSSEIARWQMAAGVAGILLAVILAYAFWLWWTHRIPNDTAPEWKKDGPRHFRLGAIGGEMSRRLDDETLDLLADFLGYFQSEQTGRALDLRASVKKTVDNGGIPSPVFQKRREIYHVLILEDRFAQGLKWNPIAAELALGLEQRAIPVTCGRFGGVPDRFQTPDGSVFQLEDLEDRRRGYLLLIFSDGKGLHRDQDKFVLESLSRWPMIAWMELREPRFWDEGTDRIADFGLPVYPATKDGLIQAMGRFLTEQGKQGEEESAGKERRPVPVCTPKDLPAHVEQLLGDALLWAQACVYIQPLSVGMADALRREFHPDLPPERMERLFALPGTNETVSGLNFSTSVLSVLRSGFVIRRNDEDQEDVLRFILEKIRAAEPDEEETLAWFGWKFQYERVRLELEPEKAVKPLAEMAVTGFPLAPHIKSEMERVVPSYNTTNQCAIFLLKEPKKRIGRHRLFNLTGNSDWMADEKTVPEKREKFQPQYKLRKNPVTVSHEEFIKKFKLDENWRPLEYVENDFTDNGDGTITDRATGLMWQQSGSDNWIDYKKAEAYIRELNQKRFAGYDDWRLPTVDELASLLEPEKQSGNLYINPIFDKKQSWCWTADKRASGGAWDVNFNVGLVYRFNLSNDFNYVRAVRP